MKKILALTLALALVAGFGAASSHTPTVDAPDNAQYTLPFNYDKGIACYKANSNPALTDGLNPNVDDCADAGQNLN